MKRSSALLNLLLPGKRQWNLAFKLGQCICPGNKVISSVHEYWFTEFPEHPCPWCGAQV